MMDKISSSINIVLVMAVLISTLSYCSAGNVYCVTPTATSCSFCPQNSANCTTLSEYAQEAERYFTSNTTMVFLPGDHTLDTNVKVANITRFTMCKASYLGNKATIVHNTLVGFSFTSVAEFKMHSLAFTSYSWNDGILPGGNYALHLQSIQNAELVNCSFHDNIGTALVVIDTNIILSGNSDFIHNHCESTFCVGSGGIVALSSNVTFTGNTTFLENFATSYYGGGAIYISHDSTFSFIGLITFINNSADFGGGAICTNGTNILSFNGMSNFAGNSAANYGGGILLSSNSVLYFVGINNFINNSAGSGGAIFTSYNVELSFNGTSNFTDNSAANYGGGILLSSNSALHIVGINNFINNSAGSGGAIFTSYNAVLTLNGTSNFINNSVDGFGGAIFTSYNVVLILINGTSNFIDNSGVLGGAIFTSDNATFSFNGTNNFINNSVTHRGGAICISGNTKLIFNKASFFCNNFALSGGAIYVGTNSTLIFNAILHFDSNGHNRDRPVDTRSEGITLGGGVFMGLKSTFSILRNAIVYWENNNATFGGAIFVADASPFSYCAQEVALYVPKEKCFFQLPGRNLSDDIDVQFVFENNSADYAENDLYGGAIDNCKVSSLDSHSSGKLFDMLVHIENNDANSSISSVPFHVHHCENNYPDYSKSTVQYEVYPGETFFVSVGVSGQRNGTVIGSYIRSYISSGDLQNFQYSQKAKSVCTFFNYTVFSLHKPNVWNPLIYLYADGPCSTFSKKLTLNVTIKQNCPPGFNISKSARGCVCEPRLKRYTNNCTITNGVGKINRDSSQHFWVGYDNHSDGLIFHPLCPVDYCVSHPVGIHLNDTDIQCAHHRSGLLCGACKEGHSLLLGSSECKRCTNSHVGLLVLFALIGIALVVLMLVCKLTIATGTLSGLVFYVNIVGANRNIFLPVKSTNVFSIFIAWLNLDFGIESCFYNGMDVYIKTWLQFVFPIYIWVLVGLIILISHCSNRFARRLGSNPVSVLATLIFFSYTKILRTLITVLYVTYLEYPTFNSMVWLYDANISYLSGKHIPLFLVAVLVFLFLFLPYTLLLLFGQWLQAISHPRLCAWTNNTRLKSFMDPYHAPYKPKHRYWPGLLLVLRFVLLTVFAFEFEPQKDTSINLLAILVGVGILHLWAWISGGVYKHWYLDALEGSFALNLIILVGATCYVKLTNGNQLAASYTSVSIALATFIGILTFQLANVTGITQKLKERCAQVGIRNQAEEEVEPDRLINPEEYEPPFHSPHASLQSAECNEAQRSLIPPAYI